MEIDSNLERMKLSHNQRFVDVVRDLVTDMCPLAGVSLDIGCGSGTYHDAYLNSVVGLDRDTPSCTAGSIKGRGECLPIKAESVDFVTSFQTIYYAQDLGAALEEMRRVATEQATLLVSVSKPRAIEAVEDPSGKYHRHNSMAWIRIFNDNGFQAERLFPRREYQLGCVRLSVRHLHSLFSP